MLLCAGWASEQPLIRDLERRGARVDVHPITSNWFLLERVDFPVPSALDRATRIVGSGPAIGEQGVRSLARLPYLREVILFDGGISGPALGPLADLPGLER